MTEIQRLRSFEEAEAGITFLAESLDGILSKTKLKLPRNLPSPDYIVHTKDGQILFYVVTTKADCCLAFRAYEHLMRRLKNLETQPEIRLYCRDIEVEQWLKQVVEPSATDEI